MTFILLGFVVAPWSLFKKIKESNAIKHTFFYIFMLIIRTKKYEKPKVSHMIT